MGRTTKLQLRLANLELELVQELCREFHLDCDQPGQDCAARYGWWASNPVCVRTQREILSIRRKLGENDPGPAIEVLRSFVREFSALGTKQDMAAWKHLAKKALLKLESTVDVASD
jgi:hypothetical protein